MSDIGRAVNWLESERRVRRDEWPEGAFLYLVPAAAYPAQRGAAKAWAGEEAMIPYSEYLAYSNEQGEVSPYCPNQKDILAHDWQRVDN